MPRKKKYNRTKKAGSPLAKILKTGILAIFCVIALFYTVQYLSATADNNAGELNTEKETATNVEALKLLEVKAPENLIEQFIEYKGFNVSFNTRHRIPNYVAYELTITEANGNESRAKSFARDENIDGCPDPSDYTRSGYDRGHMAPAADMKWDYEAMHNSFYMTNICPQKHSLNSGGWKRLEEKIRDWAIRDSSLIIITGPILSNDMETIGKNIAVPKKFFKAILSPFTNPQKAIGFIYKNDGGQKIIKEQAVSIDEIEQQTGLDLFYNLPDDIEQQLEQSCNYQQWNY